MKYFAIILTISVMFLLFYCNKGKNTSDYKPSVKVTTFINKYEKLNDFDSLFTKINSIQLDEKDSAIIGYPWGFIVTNNYYIISDPIITKNVKLFNKKGNFIRIIGRSGRGPGEYLTPNNICVYDDSLLFIFDPNLLRLTKYNLEGNYLSSTNVDFSVEDMTLTDKTIILLRKNRMGYKNDFDVFDLELEKIYSGNLPHSEHEERRKYLFGGSYRISSLFNSNLLYIGADEYKIVCYNLSERKINWASSAISPTIKMIDIPSNIKELGGYKWLRNKYSPLEGIYTLENGLILLNAAKYFTLYDYNGNYLTSVQLPSSVEKGIFSTNKNYLYICKFPYKDSKGNVHNPQVIIFKLNIQ